MRRTALFALLGLMVGLAATPLLLAGLYAVLHVLTGAGRNRPARQ